MQVPSCQPLPEFDSTSHDQVPSNTYRFVVFEEHFENMRASGCVLCGDDNIREPSILRNRKLGKTVHPVDPLDLFSVCVGGGTGESSVGKNPWSLEKTRGIPCGIPKRDPARDPAGSIVCISS